MSNLPDNWSEAAFRAAYDERDEEPYFPDDEGAWPRLPEDEEDYPRDDEERTPRRLTSAKCCHRDSDYGDHIERYTEED